MRPRLAAPAVLVLLAAMAAIASSPLAGGQGECKGDPLAIASQVQRQTVRVVGRGSAVCHGHFLWTAAHLFDEGDSDAMVELTAGDQVKVKILVCDHEADLAVLELPEGMSIDGPKWGKIARLGEPVYVVGSPYGEINSVTSGIVSFLGRKLLPQWKELDQTDATAWKGNSGGGVYRQSSGELVGILVAGKHPTHVYFIPVRAMREWAKTQNLPIGAMPAAR